MLQEDPKASRAAEGNQRPQTSGKWSQERKGLNPKASLSLYRSTFVARNNHADNDAHNDSQRHRSLNRYEGKLMRKSNVRMFLGSGRGDRLLRPEKERISAQRFREADTSMEGMGEWERLESYYRYYPVGVIAACCEREDFLRQLESGTLKVINSLIPKRCDYKNYERLVRHARLRGRCLPREKYCPNRAEILKSIGYKCQRKQAIKKKRSRSRSSDSSSSQQQKRPSRQALMAEFKKKAHANSKIFIINGRYRDLRNALLERGWVENPDPKSLLFDFKWTAKTKDIDYQFLQQGQVINHFSNNGCLTTKAGLCRSLRSMIYNQSIDVFEFYPRCYDLSDLSELENFVENYKWTYCESILKRYIAQPTQYHNIEYKVRVALLVTERRLTPLHLVSDNIACRQYAVCSPEEWQVLTAANPPSELVSRLIRKSEPKRKALPEQCSKVLRMLERVDPQCRLNGSGNIWIIKPIHLSRGRGIKCFTKLSDILDSTMNKPTQFVVQKYIENPLLIKNRKFDIRQWVLVRNYNPATVWCYAECYLRFCTKEYNSTDVANKFVHLTNNAIQKHSPEFQHNEIQGSMWTMQEFQQYLEETYREGSAGGQEKEPLIWKAIRARIEDIIVQTVRATEDQINSRKNTYELFGYDFMVDSQLNPWLIEVNSSPSMDYSTPITKRYINEQYRLVKLVLEDTAKVMLGSTRREKKNYGLFSCIYRGKKTPEF